MNKLIFAILQLISVFACAQFSIALPIVNQGNYAITDSVFMAPNGNDANPGTFALPVKSFNAAVQKLPFGTALPVLPMPVIMLNT